MNEDRLFINGYKYRKKNNAINLLNERLLIIYSIIQIVVSSHTLYRIFMPGSIVMATVAGPVAAAALSSLVLVTALY